MTQSNHLEGSNLTELTIDFSGKLAVTLRQPVRRYDDKEFVTTTEVIFERPLETKIDASFKAAVDFTLRSDDFWPSYLTGKSKGQATLRFSKGYINCTVDDINHIVTAVQIIGE